MRTQLLYCSVLVWLTMACTPGDIASDGGEETSGTATGDESGETGGDGDGDGDGDQPASPAFAEIRCVEVTNSVDACYGRPIGSDDAWVVVVQDCTLNELVDIGQATEIAAWGEDSCASGTTPLNFMPSYRCFQIAEDSVCLSGDGQWWTQVDPVCAVEQGSITTWPDWMCGAASAFGDHPWDSIGCFAQPNAACVAIDQPNAMYTWPTCFIDQFPAAPIPECVGGNECDTLEMACDSGGRCWATSDMWDGWAQAATPEAIQAAVDAGVWLAVSGPAPAGDKCFTIAGSGKHVCIVDVCGASLMGQLETEVDIYPPEPTCEMDGPWETSAQILGSCVGLLDGMAIRTVAKGCAGEVGCTCLPADICLGNAVCQDGTCF